MVELPACNTKRSVYRSFLLGMGWEAEYDHKGRKISEKKSSDLVEGEALPISWPAFSNYWSTHWSKIVIQKPSEDICDDCVVYANRHKRMKRRRRGFSDDDSSDDDSSDEENETGLPLLDDPPALNPLQEEQLRDEEEDLVLAAGRHVMMARAQREYFNTKKIEAREHASAKRPQHHRTYTFVADFAQNMYLPNFAAEQPGKTYYFSPLNMYPFGVVDTSCDPSLLTAYIFSEGTSRFNCCLLANTCINPFPCCVSCSQAMRRKEGTQSPRCCGSCLRRRVYSMAEQLMKLTLCLTTVVAKTRTEWSTGCCSSW
jgi:hypothetical protein